MRVLAVDDDPLVLMSTSMMLEELGHVVREASSGAVALKELEHEEFDLIVTDFMMPGMNGYDLMLEIQKRCPDMPVLLVSGFTNLPGETVRTVALLTKPFGEAQLAAAIRRIVPDQDTEAA